MNSDEVENLMFSLEADIKNNRKISQTISDLLTNFQIEDISEANFIGNEVIKFANNVRQWAIKGYTPEELKPTSVVKKEKTGRNSLCPCGSGKKYKNCCAKK